MPEQSSPDSVYGFAYTVTVTNTGEVTAQLDFTPPTIGR
jgi:ApaG protein